MIHAPEIGAITSTPDSGTSSSAQKTGTVV